MNLEPVKKMKVFYFDLECKPGHWIGGDYVSKIITAAAYAWNNGKVEVLTHYDYDPEVIAMTIAEEIRRADLVVGHYIRAFDMPLLNGELLKGNLQPLGQVWTHDTKLDLNRAHGRSKSQENLAEQLGLKQKKVKVSLPEWEAFNNRETDGYDIGVARVGDDVRQNRALRKELLRLGWLNNPQWWNAP